MGFSQRTAWERDESAFGAALRRARADGRELLDLTGSNPTTCGFAVDAAAVLGPLGDARALRYRPEPRGRVEAREAVAAMYRERGAGVSADEVVLAASTSELYGWLFHLLADAGDEVLIGQPSYPLFETLADLADVRLRPYPLFYDHGWWMDVARLEAAIGPRTRALVLVHPNNPTGHATGAEERAAVEGLCARHGLALVVDEVFLDYPLAKEARLRSFAEGDSPVLTFVLNGLSKMAALPQMKVGWVVVRGPEAARQEALERLEIVADTFLSVSTPAQMALPAWLAGAGRMREQIVQRVRRNRARLVAAGLDVLAADAGWSAMVRMPRVFHEESAAEALLRRGVLVQPAGLYGMEDAARVVLSLLTPEAVWDEAVERMRRVAG